MIDLQGCRVVGTVVLGGGLVGCATAVALAEANARVGKATLVLESGPAATFRETTPSQGSLRGSRVVDQTDELTVDIRATWRFIDRLEAAYGLRISTRASDEAPYLMLVRDPAHLEAMQADLTRKASPFRTYDLAGAAAKFGLTLPKNYAGVLDALESRVIDLDAYFAGMHRELASLGGSVRYGITLAPAGSGKLRDGRFYLELTDGSRVIAEQLVFATGTRIGATLAGFHDSHDHLFHEHPGSFAPPRPVPPRFRTGNTIHIPQRTIHLWFDTPGRAIVPKTVYNLDIAPEVFDASGVAYEKANLGFYMFPELVRDADGVVRAGLKAGYDPMGCSLENEGLLESQQAYMLDHIGKLYRVAPHEIRIAETHQCAYPVDVIHYPCMGRSAFHGVIVAANFIGYGAMAAYGSAETLRDGRRATGSRSNPDLAPTAGDVESFRTLYGIDRSFPNPPSAAEVYEVGGDNPRSRW